MFRVAELKVQMLSGAQAFNWASTVQPRRTAFRHRWLRHHSLAETGSCRIEPLFASAKHGGITKALKTEPGAAEAYADWARDLAVRWADAPMVCAAHSAVRTLAPGGFREEVEAALDSVSGTLERHRKQYG